MADALWPSVSGAVAQSRAVDIIANNLANVNTDGFKKDLPTFKEYLATAERDPAAFPVQPGPIKDKDFYPLDGRDQSFVVNDATYSDFRTGHIRVTQNPMDFALEGPGLFEISTPSGVRYTRQGSFKVATDGTLVTNDGYPVLASQSGGPITALSATTVQSSQGGPETQGGVATENQPPPELRARYINVGDIRGKLSVNESGEVYGDGRLVSKLSVVEFADPKQLRKYGSAAFANPRPENVVTDPPRTRVHQGAIEGSNVSPVEEMTKLINAHRLFEQDLKTMKTYDDLMGKEAMDIGKI